MEILVDKILTDEECKYSGIKVLEDTKVHYYVFEIDNTKYGQILHISNEAFRDKGWYKSHVKTQLEARYKKLILGTP